MCLDVNCPFTYVDLQNSLIDMHSKCGNLNFSRKIFNSMPERTVISWNAMLAGKISHGGLEDKGLEIFDEMVEGNDEVEAEIEHYGVHSNTNFDEFVGRHTVEIGPEKCWELCHSFKFICLCKEDGRCEECEGVDDGEGKL
uniref:Pentatricopeptide repeat-containing protein n=1 Tax=Populus alba TaxID=43335 RepID=A0A4V6A7A3_POPAL|nr:hypothetical protein D5086_0000204900 [Populus alba]